MRLLTNTVPLSPSRSERAFGTPLTNTSTLNPLGNLSCGTGNLSSAIANGGGLMPRSLPAASDVGSLGGGGGGGGGGGAGVDCCAGAGQVARLPASGAPVAAENLIVMRPSLEFSFGLTPADRRKDRRCEPPQAPPPSRARAPGGRPGRPPWRRR